MTQLIFQEAMTILAL